MSNFEGINSMPVNKKLLFFLVIYCFLFGVINREVRGVPFGTGIEILLIITLIVTIFMSKKEDWININSDLFYLMAIWFLISLIEVTNPYSSFLGWLNEIRTTALYPFLMVMLGLVILKNKRDLDWFFIFIIILSTLASINGIKQLHIGLFPGEKEFLALNSKTHLIWGKLRVFSFWDAGQFGALQAHIGFIALMLSFVPMKLWKRIFLLCCACLNFYGMLISGTRGALFGLVIAIFVGLLLSKNIKALLIGGFIAVSFLVVLKYTHIGDSNYQIYRLRTALNPKDPSLNVRFNTQRNLRIYMQDYPFGGGLGVIGYNGNLYNSDKYLSTVQPDSYYVKLWAMYGIVGFTIWFCMMLYILGKCCGLIWNMKDLNLRLKLVSLIAGFAGVLMCSYGNEVINIMPTSIVVYLSWAIIANAAKIEKTKRSTLLA
ncbi:MAG: O-antigen ligase family protein [Bacteroidota bacterium]